MSEFATELQARVDEVGAELRRAREACDDHGVSVMLARLENLTRIADRHGVDIRLPAEGAA
ncbi:hypothetical protein GCM10017673_00360 [Streptosporangium violaceochromogenes]|nr:hypothetical protein GCM10017673_00360 [Streptosporangium violaceochromogenes]